MTSFLFPGQGSQYLGMSKDFHDNFKQAQLVFEEIEDATSIALKRIIFERVISCVLQVNNKINESLLGDIHEYYKNIGYR